MKNKKDLILLIFCLVFMAGCSRLVEDSRAMVPPEKPIVEKATKKVLTKIQDAYYICRAEEEEIAEEEETIAEVIEEPTEDEALEETPLIYEYENETDDVFDDDDTTPGQSYDTAHTPGLIYLGDYEITAYEYTGSTCANGNYPTPWYTVASNYFDFGTTLYIDGVGYVVVEDRGASWHGSDWLDLYIGDEAACYEWGRQYRAVYLVE